MCMHCSIIVEIRTIIGSPSTSSTQATVERIVILIPANAHRHDHAPGTALDEAGKGEMDSTLSLGEAEPSLALAASTASPQYQ
eukprot:COSAG02_NODE_8829_length_2429_cov_2.248498_1_plen_82_part_10